MVTCFLVKILVDTIYQGISLKKDIQFM